MTTTATTTKLGLNPCGVRFTPHPHGYVRISDGAPLQGITTMISSLLFPNEYAGVDPATLAAKAQYGSRRHREIQDMIVFDEPPATDAQRAFDGLMKEARLIPIASEYTVTDFADFASNIDVVCADCSLIDIKTTATLNRAKVSWQLSIYAFLFELVNPHLRAGRLFAAWIPKKGEPQLVELPRRSDGDVKALMEAWITHRPFTPSADIDPADIAELTDLRRQINILKERYDSLTQSICLQMQKNGILSYADSDVAISLRSPSRASRFDSAALKEDAPELYARYMRPCKESAPSLSVRLKSPTL